MMMRFTDLAIGHCRQRFSEPKGGTERTSATARANGEDEEEEVGDEASVLFRETTDSRIHGDGSGDEEDNDDEGESEDEPDVDSDDERC